MLALEIVYKTQSLIYLFSYRWPGTKSRKSDFTISNYGILLRDGKVEVPWSLTQGKNTSFIYLSLFSKKSKAWLTQFVVSWFVEPEDIATIFYFS